PAGASAQPPAGPRPPPSLTEALVRAVGPALRTDAGGPGSRYNNPAFNEARSGVPRTRASSAMLTGKMVRVRYARDRIVPQYLDSGDAAWLEVAGRLLGLFRGQE